MNNGEKEKEGTNITKYMYTVCRGKLHYICVCLEYIIM